MSLLVAAVLAALPAPVTLHGVGGVTPGMTPAQVAKAWGVPITLSLPPRGSTCQTATIRKGGVTGYAIFERKRFGAVFFRGGVKTDTGIQVGVPLTNVKKAYGTKLKLVPSKYNPKAKTGYVAGVKWKLRFDIDAGGRVSGIGFGGVAVTYVEGCS